MYVVVARLVFHLPAAHSLKDRRRVVSRLKERMRSRLPASVCEVGDADQAKSATLALSVTHRDADACRRVLAAARSIGQEVRDAQFCPDGSKYFILLPDVDIFDIGMGCGG